MQITISKEAEAEFLDNLINDLSNENNENSGSKYYKIDKDVVNYILNKNEKGVAELNIILKNLYTFLEQNKKNSDFYATILNKDFDAFQNSVILARIQNIITFHLVRSKIVGKGDSVEYKLAFKQLANQHSSEIAEYESENVFLIKQITKAIVKNNPKQTLENINNISPLFKEPTYIRKGNRLIRTTLFRKEEFFKVLEGNLLRISFTNDKKHLTEYSIPTNRISDIKLNELHDKDIVGFYRNVNYAKIKSINKEKLINKLKDGIYNFYIKSFDNYIILPEKKYEENEYRDTVIKALYKAFRKEYKDDSTHVISIVVGYIGSELGLLNSEEEHLNSSYKHSYNQYLNKTVKNILTKNELI
jgi:hypothetical protein